jgi:hypothetical protein
MGAFVNEVPKSDLEAIVQRLGGQVVKNMTDLSVNRRGRTRLVVVDLAAKTNPEVRRIFPTLRVAAVSKEWILDSVGSFSLKNILPYVQGGVEKEELVAVL